jgi:phosphatidate cytidylyltransferase
VGGGALALFYCAVLPTMLATLFRDAGEQGPAWVLMAMAVVWGSDTGAYFVGRAVGKHKLSRRVSPKKTIEGAVGGMLASIAAVFVFKYTLLEDLALWQVFAIAVPANVLGQIGDLCESVIKRAHGVKDSGVIIYGHGGLLDRIDALIFAIPWFYFFFLYLR